MRRLLVTLSVLLTLGGLLAAPVAAAPDTGPALGVPADRLAASLQCSGDLAGSAARPVLLVPGTTQTPDVNFAWNYEPAFTASGRPWCAVTLPNHAMSDIQVSAEYIVSAIRTMHARAGRAISVVGFSQGGMVPRWALKFWPDTRAMVDDMIGIDASNHGTLDAHAICLPGCAPAFWQQRSGSDFLTALNAGQETYAGISYTQVYSALDEVVVPNVDPVASSALNTGPGARSNVLVQSICPLHVAEHLTMGTIDPIGYAVVTDALDHSGPAAKSRISRTVCLRAFLPGVTVGEAAANLPRVAALAGEQALTYPHTSREPALAAYAR